MEKYLTIEVCVKFGNECNFVYSWYFWCIFYLSLEIKKLWWAVKKGKHFQLLIYVYIFFPFSLYGLYFLQRQWETTVAENEIANHRIRAGFFFSHRFISTIVARLRDTMDWNVLPTSIHFLMNLYLIGEKNWLFEVRIYLLRKFQERNLNQKSIWPCISANYRMAE